MSTFPGIKFTTATPSAAIPGVPAQLDVRTGEAQVFAALTDLGDQLTLVGRKFKDIERETEFSEKVREIKSIALAAQQTARNSGDEAGIDAVHKEGFGNINAVKSDDSIVNARLERMKNELLPVFTDSLQRARNKLQKQNLASKNKNLREEYLASGNKDAYVKSLFLDVAANNILKEDALQLEKDFAVNSALARIRIEADTNPELAKKMIGELKDLTGDQLDMKDKLDRLVTRKLKADFDKAERDLTKLNIDGDLTPELLDDLFKTGVINPQLHRSFKGILEEQLFLATDGILGEKWLAGTLTRFDIEEAQRNRLLSSNDAAVWLRRLEPQNKFNVSMYDNLRTQIQEIRDDKEKFPEVRQYMLTPEVVTALGGEWKSLRKELDAAFNYTAPEGTGTSRTFAHNAVNEFWTTLKESKGKKAVLDKLRIHGEIDEFLKTNPNAKPEEIKNFVKGKLLPYQEEQARGWFGRLLFGGPLHMLSSEISTPAENIRRIFGNEPANEREYEAQLEQFALNEEENEGLEYERRWGGKFR